MKANRIERKGASAPGQAQGKRPIKTRIAVSGRPALKSPAVSRLAGPKPIAWDRARPWTSSKLPLPPCHRLLPRTAEHGREFQKFTANLGKHIASSVLKAGDVEHLYSISGSFLLVTEGIGVVDRRGHTISLECELEQLSLDLAEFLKRRRRAVFYRNFYFHPVSDEGAARWAERAGLAEALPEWVKIRLWGHAAVKSGSMRWVTSWKTVGEIGELPEVHVSLFNQCGVFMVQRDQSVPVRVTWEEAQDSVRFQIMAPAMAKAAPREFGGCFGLDAHDYEAPADPADVLTP